MRMPDVNVLVYAHRTDEPDHPFYKAWMEQLVDSGEPFALSALALVGFLRVVTNPRIYATPTPVPLALAVVDALVERHGCQVLAPGPRHWPLLRGLCVAVRPTGKLVPDAQQAAVAIEHGCTWVSRDRDFKRFASAGLRWELLEPR